MSNAPPLNPYAPPAAELDPVPAPPRTADGLASRGARLGGSMVDGLLSLLAHLPLFIGAGFKEIAAAQRAHPWNPLSLYKAHGIWGSVTAALVIVQAALQWTLLYQRGQSVGKIVAGTRVVAMDGTRPSFVQIIVLRTWIPYAFGILRRPGSWMGLIDTLFIFRGDRRCGHDLIAGTKVVPAKAPQPTP
jgi:uncharacterized RDD family membrane protein YckC